MANVEASEKSAAAPVYIDTTRPSVARAYDAALGGKDNYEVDRDLIAQLESVAPGVCQIAVENRAFLVRACRFLASQAGIEQYLDCGSGLPTAENVHQVVQRANRPGRIVYVDNDPIVVAHGRALLEDNEDTHFAAANIFNPPEVLNNELVRTHIDFAQPLAVLHVATMHSYDGDDPVGVLRSYIDAMPSGSYLVFSQLALPEEGHEHHEIAKQVRDVFQASPIDMGTFRTRPIIEEMLGGLELLDPGLVYAADWWPDGPRVKPLLPEHHCMLAGVARKP